MHRVRRYRFVGLVLALGAAGFAALGACTNYDEGGRCERNNNNDDCLFGLECRAAATLNEGFKQGGDRCCPPPGANATHPACVAAEVVLDGSPPPPPETGPRPDAALTSDSNAPSEAGPDADASGG